MLAFVRRRLLTPIATLLSQGIGPRQLALSIAIGLVVGVFPVMGTTMVLCTIAALALRLNLVAVHAVHFAATPLQLALIIPCVRVGERLVGADPQPLTIAQGMALIQQGVGHAIVALWGAIVHAVIGWLALAPVALLLVYAVALTILERATTRNLQQR